jgi:hypothetical protein
MPQSWMDAPTGGCHRVLLSLLSGCALHRDGVGAKGRRTSVVLWLRSWLGAALYRLGTLHRRLSVTSRPSTIGTSTEGSLRGFRALHRRWPGCCKQSLLFASRSAFETRVGRAKVVLALGGFSWAWADEMRPARSALITGQGVKPLDNARCGIRPAMQAASNFAAGTTGTACVPCLALGD